MGHDLALRLGWLRLWTVPAVGVRRLPAHCRAAGAAGAARILRREGDALDLAFQWRGMGRPGAALATRPDWIDCLLVEPAFSPGTLNSPPAYPSPARLPLVGFPEISMVGWPVWGGFGANPLPTRYQREWKQVKAQWQGGFPYSEGIFEDINKVLFARFYWKADTTAEEALREYIAFEYSPEVVDIVLPAIRLLEKNMAPHERAGQWSLKARDLMDQADTRLTPRARKPGDGVSSSCEPASMPSYISTAGRGRAESFTMPSRS